MTTLVKNEFSPQAIAVLGAAIVALTLGPLGIVLNTFTLFMQPMATDLGWGRGDISVLLACVGGASALVSPAIGAAVDRWSARAVVLPMTLLGGGAIAALSLANAGGIQIYLLFVAVGVVNSGMVPVGKMIAHWFSRQRGIAFGVLGFGFAVASAGLLILTRILIDAFGWREAYVILGASVVLIALPILALYFRDPQPLSVAQQISVAQQNAITEKETTPHSADDIAALAGDTPRAAWASASYWLIVGSLVLSMFVIMGLQTHGVALLTEQGLTRETATLVISLVLIGGTLSQPVIGYLIDRFDSPRVVVPFSLVAIVGLLLLHHVSGAFAALIAAFIFGFGAGGESGTTQYWLSRYFGLRHFSLIYGSIQPMTLTFAIGLGPFLLGVLYDSTGSYELDLWIMEGALVIAVVLQLLLRAYRYSVNGARLSTLEAPVPNPRGEPALR